MTPSRSAEALVLDAVRTPRGKGKPSGSLFRFHPQVLLGQLLSALVARNDIEASEIEDVVVGNGINTGDHGSCIGRLSVLAAGLPSSIPGSTVNRFCGSGQEAIAIAANGIKAGSHDLLIAGGVESMSHWPIPDPDNPNALDGNNATLRALYPVVPQGIAADLIATLNAFSRTDCDQVAVRSHTRAFAAMEAGAFDRSLVPVVDGDGNLALDKDETIRPGVSIGSLSQLSPAFATLGRTVFPKYQESFDSMCMRYVGATEDIDHVHHAGNSSGVVDGASALLLASRTFVVEHNLRPRGSHPRDQRGGRGSSSHAYRSSFRGPALPSEGGHASVRH